MFTPLTPPHIPDPRVTACAAAFTPRPDAASEARRHGIALPPGMERAVDKRVSEYAAGRYCAREALRKLGHAAPVAPATRPDRSPDWPADVVGAITHTNGFAWAAVAWRRDLNGIGIDSETIPALDVARDIQSTVLTDAEAARIAAWSGPGWDDATRVAFALSAKESLYKCVAPSAGTRLTFADADITALDPATGCFTIVLRPGAAASCADGLTLDGFVALEPPRVHTGLGWRCSHTSTIM